MKKINETIARIKSKMGKKFTVAMTAIATVSTMAIAVGAEGATPVTSVTGLSSIVSELLSVVTTVFNYCMSNWYLLIFFAGGLIFAGIKIFKGITRVAKAK